MSGVHFDLCNTAPHSSTESRALPVPIATVPSFHPKQSLFVETAAGLRLVTVEGIAILVSDLSGVAGQPTRSDGVIIGACSVKGGRLFLERWMGPGPVGHHLEEWRVGDQTVERVWSVDRVNLRGRRPDRLIAKEPLCSWRHGEKVYLYAIVKDGIERVSASDGSRLGHCPMAAVITAMRGFVHDGHAFLAVGAFNTSVRILDAESMQVVSGLTHEELS